MTSAAHRLAQHEADDRLGRAVHEPAPAPAVHADADPSAVRLRRHDGVGPEPAAERPAHVHDDVVAVALDIGRTRRNETQSEQPRQLAVLDRDPRHGHASARTEQGHVDEIDRRRPRSGRTTARGRCSRRPRLATRRRRSRRGTRNGCGASRSSRPRRRARARRPSRRRAIRRADPAVRFPRRVRAAPRLPDVRRTRRHHPGGSTSRDGW